MTSYLHIVCLPYHLLVDARHVQEVLELEAADARNIHGCRLWRDNSVRVLDLRVMLGETAPPRPQGGMVYAEGEADGIMFLCDKVLGLVQADEAAFKKLAHSIGQMVHLIDAVLPDAATGQLLYHLRLGVI
ncbi:MAG TPA: hypothetical protein HPP97_01240 [Desulfuromonadales bacterium]|nr:hypothetical protein [Desulfuromonadales bacterium]